MEWDSLFVKVAYKILGIFPTSFPAKNLPVIFANKRRDIHVAISLRVMDIPKENQVRTGNRKSRSPFTENGLSYKLNSVT